MMMQARSLGEIPESQLVEILCRDRFLRRWLFSPFLTGRRDVVFQCVPFGELAGRQLDGDVDALLLPAGEARLAVAYQFKRVKVTESTFSTLMPGKLGEIRKAVQQANATARLGFGCVLLTILVVTDGRSRTSSTFAFRGPTGEVIGQMNRAPDFSDLIETVGVARIEIVQPVDRDFTLAGGIGGAFLRAPMRVQQRPALTTALERYAATHAKD
jgi:hypothetical protein